MADKRRIDVFSGSRSESGLLQPILKRIREHPDLELLFSYIEPAWPLGQISIMTEKILRYNKPHAVLIPTDRREMVPVAMTCFYSNVPTFHFGAGACSFSHTHDDVARHIISLFSHYVFAEDPSARSKLIRMGFEADRVIVSGTTHFDDLQIDVSLCPKEPYDLFLMNPIPNDYPFFDADVTKALDALGECAMFIGPNEDEHASLVDSRIRQYCKGHRKSVYYKTLPRPQFLGLLKNCRLFISNSSSTIYEAPYFETPTVNFSIRNSKRTSIDRRYLKGGADRVVNTLATIDLSDKSKVLNKRFPNWPWIWRDLGLHTS